MSSRRSKGGRRTTRRLLIGGTLAAGMLAVTSAPASAATTASLRNGALSVFGDNGADRCTRMPTAGNSAATSSTAMTGTYSSRPSVAVPMRSG
jgi:hypothetical protein